MGAASRVGDSGRRACRVVGLGASDAKEPERASERPWRVRDGRFVGEPRRAEVGRLGERRLLLLPEGLAGLAARGDEGMGTVRMDGDLDRLPVRW